MSSLTTEQCAKLDLRENILLKRYALTASDAHKAMLKISETVNDLIGEKRRIKNVALYAPINKEIDMAFLAEMIMMRGLSICLPRVVRKNEAMVFNKWDLLPLQDKDAENIPCAMGDEVQPDVIILPVVGYNREGYRLGYGSGYYDRTFHHMSPDVLKIGIGYAFQETDQFKNESHDIPLNIMVTEKEIIRF